MSSTTRKLRTPCEHSTSTSLPTVCLFIPLCVHHVRVRCVEELKWEHIARWVSHWAIHVTRNLQIPVMGKRWPRGAPSLHICTSMLWHIQAIHPESLDGPMYTNWRQVFTSVGLIGTLWGCRSRAAGCYVFCRLACLGPICVIRPSPPAAAKPRAAKIWGKSAKKFREVRKMRRLGDLSCPGLDVSMEQTEFLELQLASVGNMFYKHAE